jgi:hypothetical protein
MRLAICGAVAIRILDTRWCGKGVDLANGKGEASGVIIFG